MSPVGLVESLWRYPVKSMGGESVAEVFVGYSGVYGDRVYAFRSAAARKGFPYLNATANPQMLRYHPTFRHPEAAARPPNLEHARRIAPGVNPANADPGDLALDVTTPDGDVLAIDDPSLIERLRGDLPAATRIWLERSDRSLTDCRPLSMISRQTVEQIRSETGTGIDGRRFRANVGLDLSSGAGFGEDEWVGRRLRLGPTVEVMVLERDPRCRMISLDPETGAHEPGILRHVAQAHGNAAGVYCAVLVEGLLKTGDAIQVIA